MTSTPRGPTSSSPSSLVTPPRLLVIKEFHIVSHLYVLSTTFTMLGDIQGLVKLSWRASSLSLASELIYLISFSTSFHCSTKLKTHDSAWPDCQSYPPGRRRSFWAWTGSIRLSSWRNASPFVPWTLRSFSLTGSHEALTERGPTSSLFHANQTNRLRSWVRHPANRMILGPFRHFPKILTHHWSLRGWNGFPCFSPSIPVGSMTNY